MQHLTDISIVLAILLLIVLFAGEPDLSDSIQARISAETKSVKLDNQLKENQLKGEIDGTR